MKFMGTEPTLLFLISSLRVMCSLRFLAIFMLVVKSDFLLDKSTENKNSVDASQLISDRNCSQYGSDSNFDYREFLGSWIYVKYFNPGMTDPKCMKIQSRIENRKILLDVSLQMSPSARVVDPPEDDEDDDTTPIKFISLVGFVDMNKEREDIVGLWSLYSELSLAPSKWIILSGSTRKVLYMICGDFPDQSSRVGEIGILSRETGLADQEVKQFEDILENYGLNVKLHEVTQNNC